MTAHTLTPISDTLGHWRAQYADDPGAWWLAYGELLLKPLPARPPPRTVTVDEDGRRREEPNTFATFRAAQGDARRSGWDGRPDGWPDGRVLIALSVERRAWCEWYDPLSDRFRELARTIAALDEHRPLYWDALAADLLAQGDRMEAALRAWLSSGVVVWLPWLRGHGDGHPTVLHAWRHFRGRWSAALGGAQ